MRYSRHVLRVGIALPVAGLVGTAALLGVRLAPKLAAARGVHALPLDAGANRAAQRRLLGHQPRARFFFRPVGQYQRGPFFVIFFVAPGHLGLRFRPFFMETA